VGGRLLHLQQQCLQAELLCGSAIFTALTDSVKNFVLCLQTCGWETASSTTTVHGGSTTVSCVCRLVGGRLLHLQQQRMEAQLLCGSAIFRALTQEPLPVSAGLWVGDCFIYNNSAWRLNYCVGGEVTTMFHLDRPMYLLGYLASQSKVYLIDKVALFNPETSSLIWNCHLSAGNLNSERLGTVKTRFCTVDMC